MFPGKVDIEQLKSTRTLSGHSKILLKCIENAVVSLGDSESFVSYLVELGRRHQVRPLKAQYLEVSVVSVDYIVVKSEGGMVCCHIATIIR